MAYVKKDYWDKEFKTWLITGCAIRDKNIIYLCLRKDIPYDEASKLWDNEIPSKLISIYLDTPETSIGSTYLKGFDSPIVGVSLKPKAQGLLASRGHDGDVLCVGSGANYPLEKVTPNIFSGITNIKCIDEYSYHVGLGRKIHKRINIDQWHLLDNGLPDGKINTNMGFSDLDGFSEFDMYAVGGEGDVWHYINDKWISCGFPSNEQLSAVLCAPDGYVYIAGEGGNLWRGREFLWEKVHSDNSTVLIHQLRWFDNKLWACDTYHLQCWDGEKMIRPEHNGKNVVYSGHIDVRDDILIVADLHNVNLYDGFTWQNIVSSYSE
ncbi:hypothetical protein [Proteus vulgaris]|uniref:hypothetical protein n=1 Tax=Proteus vulgaris TaxID=585 RepID=UPI002360479A|nr:hypothetical protein [Proteus vulgaris]